MSASVRLQMMALAGMECCDSCLFHVSALEVDDPGCAERLVELIANHHHKVPTRREVTSYCGCTTGDVLWQLGAGLQVRGEAAGWCWLYFRLLDAVEPIPEWFRNVLRDI